MEGVEVQWMRGHGRWCLKAPRGWSRSMSQTFLECHNRSNTATAAFNSTNTPGDTRGGSMWNEGEPDRGGREALKGRGTTGRIDKGSSESLQGDGRREELSRGLSLSLDRFNSDGGPLRCGPAVPTCERGHSMASVPSHWSGLSGVVDGRQRDEGVRGGEVLTSIHHRSVVLIHDEFTTTVCTPTTERVRCGGTCAGYLSTCAGVDAASDVLSCCCLQLLSATASAALDVRLRWIVVRVPTGSIRSALVPSTPKPSLVHSQPSSQADSTDTASSSALDSPSHSHPRPTIHLYSLPPLTHPLSFRPASSLSGRAGPPRSVLPCLP